MKTPLHAPRLRMAASAFFPGVFIPALAVAGLNTPNGNPTGGPTATSVNGYNVSLRPSPGVFIPQGSCPWLLPALYVASQPYNNANNVWNYNFSTLQGSLSLITYQPWVDNQVSLTLGPVTVGANPGVNYTNYGGVAFLLNYQPAGNDPTNGIHWLQVIDSNKPQLTPFSRGVTYGTNLGGGFTAYMDNSGNRTNGTSANNPYYGNLSSFATANGLGIVDEPTRGLNTNTLGMDWEAQAFLTTESDTVQGAVTTHNVKVYDGFWWGFTISVPEPSSVTLLLASGITFLARCRLRRQASK